MAMFLLVLNVILVILWGLLAVFEIRNLQKVPCTKFRWVKPAGFSLLALLNIVIVMLRLLDLN
jgi:hypothetical protein